MAYLDTNVFSNVPPRADSGQELIQIIVVVTALYDIFFEAVSLPLLRRSSDREVISNRQIDRAACVSIAVIPRSYCDIPLQLVRDGITDHSDRAAR